MLSYQYINSGFPKTKTKNVLIRYIMCNADNNDY